MGKKTSTRELKSDRISFVLDKELTPILKVIADKQGITQSRLINLTVLKIIMDNIDILDDPKQFQTVKNLINAENLKRKIGL